MIRVALCSLFMVACWFSGSDEKREGVANSQARPEVAVPPDKCDFSSFNPAHVSHFVKSSLKERFLPKYPADAVQRKVQGIVSVKIIVNRDGDVIKACAMNGDKELAKASEEAALKWKFKRKVVPGRESNVETGISFNYVLEKGKRSGSGEKDLAIYP